MGLVVSGCGLFPQHAPRFLQSHTSPLRWAAQVNLLHFSGELISRRLAKWLIVSKAVMPEPNAQVQNFNVFMQKHQKEV